MNEQSARPARLSHCKRSRYSRGRFFFFSPDRAGERCSSEANVMSLASDQNGSPFCLRSRKCQDVLLITIRLFHLFPTWFWITHRIAIACKILDIISEIEIRNRSAGMQLSNIGATLECPVRRVTPRPPREPSWAHRRSHGTSKRGGYRDGSSPDESSVCNWNPRDMYLSTLANNRRLTSRFIHERTNQSAAHHAAELRILPVAYPAG